ncbi:hypothetical protein [Janthinobacterium sp. 17J80-10]|uniref:hypothetical protein n=1 Tax=Janthinobacterium sp. 17J80-10 TaxID=2497863 RepID=UPI0010057144|nr:hypothetical protein [Janthinobacterium sp. 17J80-10]QAU35174.1 hypothetical protein EKL02_13865 [Janthinobacterium sp. 17J80-10]
MDTLRREKNPESPVKERRRMSHAGLLDSAIRMVAQLASSSDLNTRTLANRAMADLQKLRHEQPKRRQLDSNARLR